MDPKATFEAHGYVIARGMFSGRDMEEFVGEIKNSDKERHGESLDAGTMRFHSNLFYKNPVIQKFITQPTLIEFMAPIVGPDFWVRWDQAVAKGPHSGVFHWHQDNAYNRLRHQHYQLWIALSPMTPENGGLWLVPGSHKQRIRHRRDGNHMRAEGSEAYDAPDANKIFIGAEAGDVVLFSSLTLHKTYENTTDATRWAYVAEFMRNEHYDPTVPRPYFNAARGGKPYPVFTDTLPGRNSLAERAASLPLVVRHYRETVMRRLGALTERRPKQAALVGRWTPYKRPSDG
jgi:ectoine hydroxylase-related dioxygenase (phytanoyl-CoA dioxygenase family)